MGSLLLVQELLDPSSVEFSGLGDTGSSSPISLCSPALGKTQGKGLPSPVSPPYFPGDCPFCLLAQICHVGTITGERKKFLLFCGIASVNCNLPCHWLTCPWAVLCQFSASISAPTQQCQENLCTSGATSDTECSWWQFRHCSSLGMLSAFLTGTWGQKGLKPQLCENLGWDELDVGFVWDLPALLLNPAFTAATGVT